MTPLTAKVMLLVGALLRLTPESEVEGHVGQPCNLLKLCFPFSSRVQCEDGICRCRPEYPLQTGDHSCSRPKKFGESCRSQVECSTEDPNSSCAQNTFMGQCECEYGFFYDHHELKCIKDELRNLRPFRSSLLLPSAAAVLVLALSVLCCCVICWNHLCQRLKRERDTAAHRRSIASSENHRANLARLRRGSEPEDGGGEEDEEAGDEDAATDPSAPPRLPSYECALREDDAPPTYEDVVKGKLGGGAVVGYRADGEVDLFVPLRDGPGSDEPDAGRKH